MKFLFALDRTAFEKSIFCDAECYEVVNPKMINGFLNHKMGVKLRKGKFKNCPYEHEQQQIRKYRENMVGDRVAVKYKMARHKWGRVQPEGSLSLSLFHRPTRHSLCNDYYVDFDMINAQPSAFNQVCLQNGIHNKNFIEYCANSKKIRYDVAKHHNLKPIYDSETKTTLSSYEQAKKLFLSLCFGGTYNEWKKTYNAENCDMDIVVGMETEIVNVMDKIYKYNVDMIDDLLIGDERWRRKTINEKKRSVMGLWGQSVERMLQETCISSIVEHFGFDLNAIVPSQDGFMLLKTEIEKFRDIFGDLDTITKEMEKCIKDTFGFDIGWAVKPFDEQLKGGIPLCDELEEEHTYESMKTEFEKTHTKIVNLGTFFKSEPDKDINMTKQHLLTSYEHLRFNVVVKGENRDKSFVAEWLKDGSINRKRDVGIYPPDLTCPDDIYNCWRPFAMENVNKYIPDDGVVDFMLNHINILCDRNEECFDYFIKWIAMCIQYPSIKLPMPVFVSKEGSGKGSVLQLFTAMLGGSKILSTQEPSKDVWGKFNNLMLGAYIVCLDEINKKEMAGCEGKIKGLITEPTLNINDKGKSAFPIKSYHKFIAFANPDEYGNEPMNTTADDRRKFFVMCSDELKGNKEYFNKFYEYLGDTNAIKTMYEFFKNLPDARSILKADLPQSEYHKELKAVAVPPLKLFLTDYLLDNMTGDNFEKSTDELFIELKKWTDRSGYKYECNKLQFSCRLANLRLKGMEKVQIGYSRMKGWSFNKDTRVVLGISLGNDDNPQL